MLGPQAGAERCPLVFAGHSLVRGGVRRSPSTGVPLVGRTASPLTGGVGGGLLPL